MSRPVVTPQRGASPVCDPAHSAHLAEIARLQARIEVLDQTIAHQDGELFDWEAGRRLAISTVFDQQRWASFLDGNPCARMEWEAFLFEEFAKKNRLR